MTTGWLTDVGSCNITSFKSVSFFLSWERVFVQKMRSTLRMTESVPFQVYSRASAKSNFMDGCLFIDGSWGHK